MEKNVVKIRSAAIRYFGNQIAIGRKHDVIYQNLIDQYARSIGFYIRGFVTTEGQFVDRRTAAKIAIAAGQIKELEDPSEGLHSGDLPALDDDLPPFSESEWEFL